MRALGIPRTVAALAGIAAVALGVVSCTTAAAGAPAGDGGAGGSRELSAGAGRAALLERLARLTQSGQFLFGQQHATLWGMYLDGSLVSTGKWFDATARAGHFTSDSEAVVGDRPAVLGVSLGMLAFEPTSWNRRATISEAIRRQVAEGGLVTMDWHAPSCDADVRPQAPLEIVAVDGHDVAIEPVAGGATFYAEEEYKRPIRGRADVPESLKCLCQIANDAPITAGPHQGTSARTWLIAQAKHAARVLRDERLAGLPIIVRPFHEHTGAWFWWGQPYWSCAALLGSPQALAGPAAFEAMVRTFVSSLRAEPGMGDLVFAYSPDKLLGPNERERFTAAENKVKDPAGRARDLLRERLGRELAAAGLAYASPAERASTVTAAQAAASVSRASAYVAQRRRHYAEAYAGDDVYDVLGIDLYHPIARAADRADRSRFGLQLRVLAEEARARGKPYAWTEAGTYRLQLLQLASATPAGEPLRVHPAAAVEEGLARLFDPGDRARLLRHFGLTAVGPVILSPAERAAVVPVTSEDWFNTQLLPLAKDARVAFALVWQTYYDSAAAERYFHYYVPYPGHPEAQSFARFYADPATCFLRDACGR